MDIDLIYTWVDGRDPEFIQLRSRYAPEIARGNGLNRWSNHDELRYSLRSIAAHAKWLRRIHIVTNGQRPAWLNLEHPKLRLVTHAQIYKWQEHLPTFNSVSIESHLHRIPGLSEHFLYMNDDFFLGAMAWPRDFFNGDGSIVVGSTRHTLPVGAYNPKREAIYKAGVKNAARLLRATFGPKVFLSPHHQVKAYTRSIFQMAEERWPEAWHSNSAAKFRSNNDIAMNHGFLTNFAVHTGHGKYRRLPGILACAGRDMKSNLRVYKRIMHRKPKFFCINDVSSRGNAPGLKMFLQEYFPHSSPFEIA